LAPVLSAQGLRAMRNGILRARALRAARAAAAPTLRSPTPESSMSISQDQVVSIHYTLRDDAGEVIDSSAQGEPLSYLHGHGNLIAGLERELTGRKPGDRLQVKIAPGDGYGEYDQSLVQQVPRRALKGVGELRAGMRLQAQTPQGPRVVTVTRVSGDLVTLDGNHPLAGKNLNFEVEVAAVRPASEEELAHGHVHGAGGHHH
jgi:FKBP-type peptidyl-prolyl cis-trans isomerase SlyD